MPLYNKGLFVKRALDSVLCQTHADLEVIVVDDGSTDDGPKVVESFKDRRMQLIHQPNAGPGAARNRGITASSSEWVGFLDADDWWHPDFLRATLKAGRDFSSAVAVFSNHSFIFSPTPIFPRGPGPSRVLPDYFAFCLQHGGFGMCSSALIAKREVLLRIGLFATNRLMGEDLDTWARLAWTGPIVFVPEPLATYDDTTSGLCTHRLTDCDIWSTYQAWKQGGRIPSHLQGSSLAYVSHLRLMTARAWFRAGHTQEALQLTEEVPWPQFLRRGGLSLLAIILVRWIRGQLKRSPNTGPGTVPGGSPKPIPTLTDHK
ncbi:MAG TPA: glycosyltransferase family A protein [Verrucomicrobiae bacterium]|nr:glycosyltransferase family A protein [Verrucomicrobiae bacterium]